MEKPFEVRPIRGVMTEVIAPPSKALTLRALFISSLAKGDSEILHPLISDDTIYAINALQEFGVKMFETDKGIMVQGVDGRPQCPKGEIFLGKSGLCSRFFLSYASLVPGGTVSISGDASRPNADLVMGLKRLGVDITMTNDSYPVLVRSGTFKGGETDLKGEKSSQYFSSIMISAPYASEEVKIKAIGNLVSRPYVDLTIKAMADFGVKVRNKDYHEFIIPKGAYVGKEYAVEGDYTQASYLMAAAAIVGGTIKVHNLPKDSLQGDKFFLKCLLHMGCDVAYGPNSVTIESSGQLKSLIVSLRHYPDLVPILAVMAAYAKGKSEFTGIAHLKFKESNRLFAITDGLKKMGIPAHVTDDGLEIHGGRPKHALIDPHYDHRIAMAFAIAGLKTRGISIADPSCVKKSFPDFWKVLQKI